MLMPRDIAAPWRSCSSADDTDAVLVMNCPTALASSTEIAQEVVALVDAQRTKDAPAKPVLATWLGDEASREARKLFAIKNIASFATPAEGVDGFMQLVSYARAQEQLMRTPPSLPQELAVRQCQGRLHHPDCVSASRSVLSEVEAKKLARRLRHSDSANWDCSEPGAGRTFGARHHRQSTAPA